MREKHIHDYLACELSMFSDGCNFTADEARYLGYARQGYSRTAIALAMCYDPSTVTEIVKRVRDKITRFEQYLAQH